MPVDVKIMDFNQYTKKPVAIRAAMLSQAVWHNIRTECKNAIMTVQGHTVEAKISLTGEKYFTIDTLEGKMKAKVGDMLIIGIRGEIYACDKEIFDKTYDKVVL